MTRIAVVGGGRIGEALVSGLLGADWKVRDLVIAEKLESRARQLTTDYGVRVTDNLGDAIEGADVVVIAVKPGDVDAVLTELAEIQDNSDDDQLLVSLVAGIPTGKMENLLPAGTAVVRVMPNTPMLVGKGASAACGGRYANADQLDLVERLCDDIVILSKGRVVADGPVEELRRAGETHHRILAESDLGWLRDHPGVRVLDLDGREASVSFVDMATEQAVLAEALRRGPVRAFGPTIRPLSEIYREITR